MVKLLLKAALKDGEGNPLSGKTIEFYYSYDKSTWNLIESKTTDENGECASQHETDKTTYYKARFPGDETYDEAEAIAEYYISPPPSPPTLAEQMMSMLIMLLPVIMIIMMITLLTSIFRKK